MFKFFEIFRSFSKNEKFVFILATVLGFTSAVLLSISFFNQSTYEVPIYGGRFTEGIVGQPIYVNPVLAGTNNPDRDLIKLFYANVPALAEEIKSDDNGKTWTVRIKENAKWQDGEKITSDDVIFTIQKIQDQETKSPLFSSWQGVTASRVSEREFKLFLAAPYAFFDSNIKNLYPIPKHLFADTPVANWRISNYNLEPIGSGPYQFVEYSKKPNGFITEYHLKASDSYALGRPYITDFYLKFFADEKELIDAYNFAKIDAFGKTSQQDLNQLTRQAQILSSPTSRYYAIFLNQSANSSLQNINIRLALQLATNKQELVEKVFSGKASPVNGPIIPGIEGFDDALYANKNFSTENANSILDNLGFKVGADGIREKKDGKTSTPLEFTMIVPQVKFLTDTAEILKENWKSIGVKLNVAIIDPKNVSTDIIKNRDYEMIAFGNILENNPDLFSFWHSSQRSYPGLNLSLYSNKKVDALIEAIRKNPDPEGRKQDVATLESLINQDMPAIFLYSPDYVYVSNKSLKGFSSETFVTPSDRFNNVEKWSVNTARTLKGQ